MKFKERKKYAIKVLEYLKYDEENKRLALKHHYGILGRITKSYINFEKEINKAFIKANLMKRKEMNKELETIVNEFHLKKIGILCERKEQENMN